MQSRDFLLVKASTARARARMARAKVKARRARRARSRDSQTRMASSRDTAKSGDTSVPTAENASRTARHPWTNDGKP